MYQSLPVDGRPPGAVCIECLKALGFPLNSVEFERSRRSGYTKLPKAKRRR